MQKSTKKILDELFEVSPSLKSEKNLKSLVVFMEHHTPKVQASKEFKNKLGKKITTIAEFKQIQPKQKFNPMTFVTPIFLMVFGIFAVIQFQSFIAMDEVDIRELPSPNAQEFIIDNVNSDILEAPLEENTTNQETQTNTEPEEIDISTILTDSEALIDKYNDKRDQLENFLEIQSEQSLDTTPRAEPQETVVTKEPDNGDGEKQILQDNITKKEKNSVMQEDTVIENSDQDQKQSEKTQEVKQIQTSPETQNTENNESTQDSQESQDSAEGKKLQEDTVVEDKNNTEDSTQPDEGENEVNQEAPLKSERFESTEVNNPEETQVDDELESNESDEMTENPKQAETIQEESTGDTTSSSQGDYYTCVSGKIDYIDEVDMKRIIKTYCSEKGGEYSLEKGTCVMRGRQHLGIDFIQRDLCE